MREILFRGKQVIGDEWVEGFFVIAEDTFKPDNEKTCFILETDEAYFGHGEFSGAKRVDPETIGQFTGLTDKNGKRIFEGDIVKGIFYGFPLPIENFVFTIGWQEDIAGYRANYFENVEVIGNIHDNPELLKGGVDNV